MLPVAIFVDSLKNDRFAHLSLVTLIFIIVSSTACTPKQSTENKENNPKIEDKNTLNAPLRLAAAANLAQVLPSIVENYQSDANLCPDTDDCAIEVTYASSGKLYAQINAGAPYDIYLAANQTFPAKLATSSSLTQPNNQESLPDSNHSFSAIPFTYTQGQLALYSRSKKTNNVENQLETVSIQSQESYQSLNVQKTNIAKILLVNPDSRVAIANPELAPYGTSAQMYLQTQDIYDELLVNKRLIQAENISQTFQYVHTGNVDFGFVALSQLIATQTDPSYYQTITVNDYPAILQDGIILSAHPNAISFANYLQSAVAQKSFVEAGYLAVTSK